MSRPSDGFDLDELKEEFDWMHEFLGRMAERITRDPDVHNLVDYVTKLELENETLKACSVDWELDHCPNCQDVISLQFKMDENARLRSCLTDAARRISRIPELEADNARLRELVLEIWRSCPVSEDDCAKCPHHIGESDEVWCDIPILMSELGVEGTNDGQVAIQRGV